jgi:hypothetical protein
VLHLDANDVDSYDGDGDVWYDVHDHEYTPATNVSEHFNTVTWTGDGASTRSITGVGFQPGLVWAKARQAQNHTIYDSVRGTGRYLASDGTTAETTVNTYGQLTSFDSDGFTGSEGSNQTYSFFNSSSQTYVAWCFKAGVLANKSAEFNGSSSKITLPSSLTSALDVSTKTISMWIKADPQSSGYGMPFSMNSTSLSYGRIILQLTNSNNLFEFLVGTGGSYPSATIVPGAWYHIAVSINGSSYECFVNGTSVGTGTNNNGGDSSGDTTIGVYNASNNHYWDGKISQVRFFNSALTSSQITQLYNETPGQNNGHLLSCIAAFPLNDNANEIDGSYTATASNVAFGLPGYATRNNNGTVESAVSVNNDLGFSVATYTGNGTANQTVGNGLDSPVELLIVKRTNATGNWLVWNRDVTSGNGKYLYLDLRSGIGGPAGTPVWDSSNTTTMPTSGLFNINNNSGVNASSGTYVAYSFTSKRGVSKVGNYIGNGTTDNKIYTGFEPAFFMIKNTSTDNTGWLMKDNARGENSKTLLANSDAVEYNTTAYWTCDFERDGVRLTYGADNEFNKSGDTYIYYAVAKDTNETELADTVGFKPSIDPDDHFNTVIYDGSASSQSITGVGFTPDLVWVKCRNVSNKKHVIVDSVRGGDGTRQYWLSSNIGDAEASSSQIETIDSDGFTLFGDKGAVNKANSEYVAWCLKAGGTPTGSDKLSIDGISYADEAAAGLTAGTLAVDKLSANTKLGFSIVKLENKTLNSGSNMAHGLGAVPELIIAKQKNTVSDWIVFSKTEGPERYLLLNEWNLSADDTYWGDISPTSTLVNFNWSSSSEDYIFYCFASKRGVSKVGAYEGTGTSGNKIFTEFEPAFIMIKNVDDNANWLILDNVRDTDGVLNELIYANLKNPEATASTATVTPNRDGFTIGNSNSVVLNRSGDTFIYLAFAKNTNNEQHLELNLEADSYSGSGDWLDSSGNGNNGTINGATWEQELGNFFEFNGVNDTVQIGSSMYKSLPMTVEAWVNPLLTDNSVIYSNYDSSAIKGFYIRVNTNGQILVDAYSNPSGTYQRTLAYSSEYLTANKWSHVAVTFTTSYVTVYVNGESSGQVSTNANGITFTPSFSTLIGARGGTSDEFYGKISQVRAYSTELSLAQVRQNYNFTKPKYPNEFHGDINGATWDASGYFDFDGSNDNVDITGNPLGANNFTYSAWFNADTVSVANQNIITSNAGHVNYGLQVTGTGLSMYSLNSSGGAKYLVSSTGLVSSGTWYHVAYVKSSISGHSLYLNGTVVASDSSFTGDCDLGTLSETTIGSANNNIQWFNGKISKVKLYNKVLTQSEITALYDEGY